jgi:hypothetical protein
MGSFLIIDIGTYLSSIIFKYRRETMKMKGIVLTAALTLLILASLSSGVEAATHQGVTMDISPGGTTGPSQGPVQIFGFGMWTDTPMEDSLFHIQMVFVGTGFEPSDLQPITSDSSTSGVGLFMDTGGVDDNYDVADTPVPIEDGYWTGNQVDLFFVSAPQTILPFPPMLIGDYYWIIVVQTSATISNDDVIQAVIPPNSIITQNGGSQPNMLVPSTPITCLIAPEFNAIMIPIFAVIAVSVIVIRRKGISRS